MREAVNGFGRVVKGFLIAGCSVGMFLIGAFAGIKSYGKQEQRWDEAASRTTANSTWLQNHEGRLTTVESGLSAHTANTDIHMTADARHTTFVSRSEFQATVAGQTKALDDFKRDMREDNGKLEAKIDKILDRLTQ